MNDTISLAQNHFIWWGLGVVLVILEIIVPTSWLIWPGIAALLVGTLSFFVPALSGATTMLAFAGLSIIVTLLGRRYLKLHPVTSDKPLLNRRTAALIGRKASIIDVSGDGFAAIRIDDSLWRVKTSDGSNLAVGSLVEITGADSTVLIVTPA